MNHPIRKILSLLFILFFTNTLAEGSVRDSLQEKIDKVAMRRLGHEFLKCIGDYESRVLPIEKIGEQYKIVFEREFAIDPDDLISTIDEILKKSSIVSLLENSIVLVLFHAVEEYFPRIVIIFSSLFLILSIFICNHHTLVQVPQAFLF